MHSKLMLRFFWTLLLWWVVAIKTKSRIRLQMIIFIIYNRLYVFTNDASFLENLDKIYLKHKNGFHFVGSELIFKTLV